MKIGLFYSQQTADRAALFRPFKFPEKRAKLKSLLLMFVSTFFALLITFKPKLRHSNAILMFYNRVLVTLAECLIKRRDEKNKTIMQKWHYKSAVQLKPL